MTRDDQIKAKTRLAKSVIRDCADADAAAIGKLCVDALEIGDNASIWHNAAKHYGYLGRCSCVPCITERKRSWPTP
jgi:hypothetical protein